MNLPPFTGPGAIRSRRNFWDQIRTAVLASQKIAGRFVTVSEHPGKGTVINVASDASRGGGGGGGGPAATGACCTDGVCSEVTQEECENGGGYFYGVGTTCSGRVCDEGVPCSSVGLSVTNSFSSTVSADPGHCLDWNVTGHERTHEFTQDELNFSTPASGFEDCQTGCNGDPFVVLGVTYYYTNGNSVGWYFRASFDCGNRTVSVEVDRSINCSGCTPDGCPDDCSPFNLCSSNWDKIYTISLDEPGEHTFDDDITNGSGFTAHFTTSITLTI